MAQIQQKFVSCSCKLLRQVFLVSKYSSPGYDSGIQASASELPLSCIQLTKKSKDQRGSWIVALKSLDSKVESMAPTHVYLTAREH